LPTAHHQAGRLLIVGIPGPELDPDSREILKGAQPGGVILFARNVVDAEQVIELVGDLRATLPRLLVYVDAEGGRVDRFKTLLGPGPSGAALAASAPRLAERAGRWMGYALRSLACDVDLAPVVDLDVGEQGNALDERYLGSDPDAVVKRGRYFLRGLHSTGVGSCIKHFPGLGAARADTHDTGAEIVLDAQTFATALAPFQRLGDEAGAMMASHASYPGVDPTALPAGLSPAISTTLLRDQLGFGGVLFSDDLDMHALDSHGSLPQRAASALEAGCDGIFVCQTLAAAPGIVERLAHSSLAPRRRQAVARLETYRDHILTRRGGTRRYSVDSVRRHLAKVTAAAQASLT